MYDGDNCWIGRSEGQHANLQVAFENAWREAKEDGAPPGEYDVKIKIEASNPIHAYIVIISPTG